MTDRRRYRTRIALAGAILLPLLAVVVGFHARDATRRGESLVPVVLGAVVAVAVLAGTLVFVTREGPAAVAARSARFARWLVPLGIAVGVLRLVAWLAGRG